MFYQVLNVYALLSIRLQAIRLHALLSAVMGLCLQVPTNSAMMEILYKVTDVRAHVLCKLTLPVIQVNQVSVLPTRAILSPHRPLPKTPAPTFSQQSSRSGLSRLPPPYLLSPIYRTPFHFHLTLLTEIP